MKLESRILVVGGDTLVGSALVRELQRRGHTNVLPAQTSAGTSNPVEPCWSDAGETMTCFTQARPEFVFVVAGKSGGIAANQKYPASLMRDNLLVSANVLEAAHRCGVKKLLYLASSCCYPRDCPQPMRVEALMTGKLEPTNEAYATAKLAGLQLCQAYRAECAAPFIAAIPANPFGPGDCFDPEDSHVIPALMRRFHEAKMESRTAVTIWGSGAPLREFIFADDLADACLLVMDRYNGPDPINLGTANPGTGEIGKGHTCSIRELAECIQRIVGFPGEIVFDASRPDGMPLKVLDSGPLIRLGWQPHTTLTEALERTYQWFLEAGFPEATQF